MKIERIIYLVMRFMYILQTKKKSVSVELQMMSSINLICQAYFLTKIQVHSMPCILGTTLFYYENSGQ